MSEQILAELRKTKESLEEERARLRAVEHALEASATQCEQAEQRAARAEEKCRVFEAAFQEGEAIDRALMATAPDAIVLCDLDTRILKVNPQGARLVGYETPSQLEGKRCLDFLEPEDRERAFSGIREALASGFCKYQRYQLRRVDGTRVPVELYATILRDPAGAPQSLLAIIKDISKHMRTEKALTQAVSQWQVTFDAISDAITLLDPNGRVTQCNRALKEILGLPFHEIIGKHCYELLHRLPQPITDCPLQRMRQSRHSESNVMEVNGRWLQIRVDPVLDPEGRLLGGVHILSDITERKRGEDSLRRLAAIVDSSQDAILGKDLNGTVLSWNTGAERIYGYSAAEMVGKNVSLLLPPECSDELPSLLERIRRGERVETYETVRSRRDGRRIDVSLTISPIKDDTGVVIGASTIVRDITAQKWAQERIRFQASLLDQVRNAVIATDMDGKIIYWNHFAETLYQWKAAEVTGKLHTIISAAKSLPVVKETLSVTRATGHWEGELQSQRKDGSLFPAYLVQTLIHDADGAPQGYLGVIIDITERMRDEQALRESEAKYHGLFNTVQAGILAHNADGAILDANARARDILSLGAYFTADPTTQNIHEDGSPFPPEEHPAMVALRTQKPVSGVTMGVIRADGEKRWILINAVPITTNEGVLGAVATFLDISKRKQLEEELRQSQKMEAIGRLAGGVAHDFNNLLMPILTFGEMLLSRLEDGDPLQHYADQIVRTAERASALPRQLLAFSRRQILQPKVLKLDTLITEMEKMLRTLVGEDISFTVQPAPGTGLVKADQVQLEQVLMNLSANARDAMPNGGSLLIETKNVELDAETVRLRPGCKPGRYVMLAVSDTGCGMDRETLAQIFEPFFTTKEKGKGTGLGLATVYGIVKQSGGDIRVYSEVGKGTTFKVYLPRVDAAPEPVAAATRDQRPRGGTETILLVEDEDAVRESVRELLEANGYHVLDASNGDAALALCGERQEPIHLLLTDVVMPGMSGNVLAERLRGVRPGIKTLFMSGYTEDAIVHHGVLLDGVSFLQKPFSPRTLASKVREVLDAGTADPAKK